MLIAVLLAVVLALGPHPGAAAILAFAYLSPPGFLIAAVGWAVFHATRRLRARRQLPRAEADFLRGMAGELEAGASIRQAVIAASDRAPDLALDEATRRAATGRPPARVAEGLEMALPLNGRLASAAYQLVAETGAKASAVFSGLAVRAAAAGDIERERRVLTAQARMSAWVVGGLPVAVTLVLTLSGRGPGTDGVEGAITLLGVGLIASGALVVWVMVRDR